MLLCVIAGSRVAVSEPNAMNKAVFFTVLLLTSVSLKAQAPAMPPNMARFQPNYDELKSALSLSDDQVSKLKQIQQEKMTATQAFYAKMAEKQKELNQLLEANSNDAQKVGQLMIELQNLRKQAPPGVVDIRERATGVLTADQKSKLDKLEEAQKLRGAVDQAVQLGLLQPPAPSGPGKPTPISAKPAAK
jgi:Spy/CpxP family protein refolding chaperone